MDPDPERYSEYESGSRKLLNTDPIQIRIHDTACNRGTVRCHSENLFFESKSDTGTDLTLVSKENDKRDWDPIKIKSRIRI